MPSSRAFKLRVYSIPGDSPLGKQQNRSGQANGLRHMSSNRSRGVHFGSFPDANKSYAFLKVIANLGGASVEKKVRRTVMPLGTSSGQDRRTLRPINKKTPRGQEPGRVNNWALSGLRSAAA